MSSIVDLSHLVWHPDHGARALSVARFQREGVGLRDLVITSLECQGIPPDVCQGAARGYAAAVCVRELGFSAELPEFPTAERPSAVELGALERLGRDIARYWRPVHIALSAGEPWPAHDPELVAERLDQPVPFHPAARGRHSELAERLLIA